MANLLSLEIPPIGNPKVLRVYDTSAWDSDITVSTRTLEITPPGYTSPTIFTYAKGYDRLFNTGSFGITTSPDPASLTNLPDGIYLLKQTADTVWVEYNHLRQVLLLKDYYKALCTLNFYPCDTLDVDTERKRKELSIIKSYIDAAQAKVEWCGAPNEGLELHHYARKLLTKFSLEKCKTC